MAKPIPSYIIKAELKDFRSPATWRRFKIKKNLPITELAYYLEIMFEMYAEHQYDFTYQSDDGLVVMVNNPEEYSYDNFPDFYKPYGENKGESTDKLLEFLLSGNKGDLFIEPIPDNGKPNTVYNLGNINNIRRHAGLLDRINQIDTSKENAIFVFTNPINSNTAKLLDQIPEDMQFARIAKPFESNLHDYVYFKLYKKFGMFKNTYEKIIDYEFSRIFPGWRIDKYVNFGSIGGAVDKLIRAGLAHKNKQ